MAPYDIPLSVKVYDLEKESLPDDADPNDYITVNGKTFLKKPMGLVRDEHIRLSHRQIFRLWAEQGFRNIGQAIRRQGTYQPTVASRPGLITNTKSWKALMDEYISDERVAVLHSQILDKRDMIKVKDKEGNEQLVDNGPDATAALKAIDMVYKMRGRYKEDKVVPGNKTVMYNLFYKPEVRKQIQSFEDGIKQSLRDEIQRRTRVRGFDSDNEEGEGLIEAQATDVTATTEAGVRPAEGGIQGSPDAAGGGVPAGHDGGGDGGLPTPDGSRVGDVSEKGI
jgi:hypothetical protein